MSSITFKKKLKMANKLWSNARKRAEEAPSSGGEVEDGRYRARLFRAEVGESQASGRIQAIWGFEILEGEYKGQKVYGYDGLETENNLMWMARKISRLGYEAPEDLEGVTELLEELQKEKPVLRIRLKTKGEYQNVYIDKVLQGEEAGEDSVNEGEEPTEEDVPEEPKEEPEEEEPEPEDEEVAVEEGMTVSFSLKDGEHTGTVKEVLEDDGMVRVTADNGKTYRLKVDKISLEEKKPEKKVTKKTSKLKKRK